MLLHLATTVLGAAEHEPCPRRLPCAGAREPELGVGSGVSSGSRCCPSHHHLLSRLRHMPVCGDVLAELAANTSPLHPRHRHGRSRRCRCLDSDSARFPLPLLRGRHRSHRNSRR